jgi:hypothetical protein
VLPSGSMSIDTRDLTSATRCTAILLGSYKGALLCDMSVETQDMTSERIYKALSPVSCKYLWLMVASSSNSATNKSWTSCFSLMNIHVVMLPATVIGSCLVFPRIYELVIYSLPWYQNSSSLTVPPSPSQHQARPWYCSTLLSASPPHLASPSPVLLR